VRQQKASFKQSPPSIHKPAQRLRENGTPLIGLDGTEAFDVVGLDESLQPQSELVLRVTKDGENKDIPVLCRIDTPIEVDYYRHGGILPYVLRQLAG
jgi:aconitate hydratase